MFLNIAQGGVLSDIRSEFYQTKTKGEEDNVDSIESQRGAQVHPMMMIQSKGSMTNRGMKEKRKSMSPAKKSLAPSTLQKKKNLMKRLEDNSKEKSRKICLFLK